MAASRKSMTETLARPGSQYTDDIKRDAMALYVIKGNLKEVARQLDIPRTTLTDWVKSDWGQELIVSIRHEKSDEIDSGFTRILDKTTQVIEDRLENGDFHGYDQDGNILYKPVSMRDAATLMGITFDKQRINRNQATSITASDATLNSLADQFKQAAKYMQAREIEGEIVE